MNDCRKDNVPVTSEEKRRSSFLIFIIPAFLCIILLLMLGGFYMDLFVIRDSLSIVRIVPLLIFTFAFGLKILLCVISENKFIRNIPLYIAVICCIMLFCVSLIYGYEALAGSLVYGSMVTVSLPGMAAGSMFFHYLNNMSFSDEEKFRNRKRMKVFSATGIFLVLFTIAGYSTGLFLHIVPGCGEESHSAAVLGNEVIYFEDNYPYIFDLTVKKKEDLFTKAGESFTNDLGVFVTGAHDGVYRISEDNIKMIFEFEGTVGEDDKLSLVDITNDMVFWKVVSRDGENIIQKVYSGEYSVSLDDLLRDVPYNVTLIHSYSDISVTPVKINDGIFYFFSTDMSGSVKCIDISSKEERVLVSGAENGTVIENVYFYDDCFMIVYSEGIYRSDYDGNIRLLTSYKPLTPAFDRVGDKVYFVTKRNDVESSGKEIISLRTDTGEIRTYARMSGLGGLGHDVSEIIITDNGCVFTDPSASLKGGLYFYNKKYDEIVKITR